MDQARSSTRTRNTGYMPGMTADRYAGTYGYSRKTSTFESKVLIQDIVGEMKAVELSDEDDERSKEEKAAQMNCDDELGQKPPQDP